MNPIIPKTNSAPGAGAPASLYLGELATNRSTGKLYLGCDGGVQEVGNGTVGGQISAFTGDGSATAFSPVEGYSTNDAGSYLVSVGGIDQRPTTDWTISSANGGTITFASAPPNGAPIVVRAFIGTGTTSGNATKLQGRLLADTAPTNGQAVVWDSANSTWKPGTVSGGGGSDIGGRAWDAAATYSEGDLVATSQREAWICIQNDNTNHDPTEAESAWWAPLPADAVSLQLRPVATTAPLPQQQLTWSAVDQKWAPDFPTNLQWRGEWFNGSFYTQNDAVSLNGIVYVCVNAYSSGVSPDQGRLSSGFAPYRGTGPITNAEYLQFIGVSANQPENGDFLSFTGTNWEPSPITKVSGYTFEYSSLAAKNVLVFNGTAWVNDPNVIGKINEIIGWINSNGGSITPL